MSRTEIHSYDFFVWFIVGALLAAPGFIRCMIGRGKRRPYGDLFDIESGAASGAPTVICPMHDRARQAAPLR
jgi:hypothetical protein